MTSARTKSHLASVHQLVSCLLCLCWGSTLFDPTLNSAGVCAFPSRLGPWMLFCGWNLPAILPIPRYVLVSPTVALAGLPGLPGLPGLFPFCNPQLKSCITVHWRQRQIVCNLFHSPWQAPAGPRIALTHSQVTWNLWQQQSSSIVEPSTSKLFGLDGNPELCLPSL